jgi:excisionase family DNA binding protein
MVNPALLTVNEVAERLRIAPQTAYRLCRSPGFPASRIGGQIRIDPEALEEWVRQQRPTTSR